MRKNDGRLGFRHFSHFNKTLLAKQAWRLLENGKSLFFNTLKAKYFKHTSFDNAELGRHPSYTWKSILVGCDELKKGLRWRIGNGKDIRIWTDKWLHPNQLVVPNRTEVNNDLRVKNL